MPRLSEILKEPFYSEIYSEAMTYFGSDTERSGGVSIALAIAIAKLHQQIQELKSEIESLKKGGTRERNKRQSYE